MEIDPHHLPDDPAALRQIVIGLLEELDTKERRLQQVQHMLEQLLRHRYGPKRERVDENQLFLFAAEIVHAGKDNEAPPASEETAKPKRKRKGHGRKPLPKSLERKRRGALRASAVIGGSGSSIDTEREAAMRAQEIRDVTEALAVTDEEKALRVQGVREML